MKISFKRNLCHKNIFSYAHLYFKNIFSIPKNILLPGLVPEPARQVAEARQHEEGSWAARPQRAPRHLLGRAHPARGDREEGATAQGEEADETGATFYCNLMVFI